ncbi:MAG: protein kinase domain-containing protein [Acidiferrobacter sp.]
MESHRAGRNEPHAPALEPGRTLGPYLVLSTLSSSVRSTVYMGQDLALDRPVALKVAARGTPSVITEGRVLARFNHPHIVTLYGLWSQPPALILEYLVGETLKNRRDRGGGLPAAAVRNWMVDILTALETLHSQGSAHGALRADNVFLTTDQCIKLLDFRQSQAGDAPPAPADDIRAAGRLIHELLGAQDEDPLTAIARSATLGRFPTARALRRALTIGPVATTPPPPPDDDAGTTRVGAQSRVLAPVLVPVPVPTPRTDPAPLWVAAMAWVRRAHRQGHWPRLGRRRLGLLVLALGFLIMLVFAGRAEWRARQPAIVHSVPVAQRGAARALVAVPMASKPRRPPHPVLPPPTHLGTYAALAHAWGN